MRERGDLVPAADPDALALAMLAAAQGGPLLSQVSRDTRALEAVMKVMIDQVRSHLAPDRG